MKKLVVLLLALLTSLSTLFLSGCTEGASTNEIVISVPDGAPALAVYKMLDEKGKIGGYDVKINIVSGTEEIATQITSGESDVCVMPTNLATKLYNKGVDVKLASVNVFGVLYMIGSQPITSLNDLLGKVIVYTGAGGTPELTLQIIFDKNNIEYVQSETAVEGKVAITAVTAGSDAIKSVKLGKADYAVLGEPVVTQANKNLGTSVVLDLQQEWSKIIGENSYTQAGVVLSKSVYNKNVFVRGLMEQLSLNSEYLLNNYEGVKETLQNSGSALSVDFTQETVERLNIGHKTAVDAKEGLEKYLNALYEYNPSLIGDKMPDEGFYLAYEK